MKLSNFNNSLFLNREKKNRNDLTIFVCIYLQLINIIAGPDIVLKFVGYRYNDVSEIRLGWFTTTVNLFFILIAVSVLLNNRIKSYQLFSKSKKIIFILFLTFFSVFFVADNMIDQSIILTILTIGYFIKICSLIILFEKYNIEFSMILLRLVKILMVLMLLYLLIFFDNGFSSTLIGRYQSFFFHPNSLGQFTSLVIVLLFADRLYFYKKNKIKYDNFSFFFFLLIAVGFVIMSQSFTNFLLVSLLLLLYFSYSLKFNLLRFLFFTSVVNFFFFFFTNATNLSFLSFSNNETVSTNFTRDLTLTGRTQIWRDVVNKVQSENKIIFGYGLGGFWGKIGSPSSKIDNPLLSDIGQSHNGIIELYTQYGLLGILLFWFLLYNISQKLWRIKSDTPNVVFFNFFLIFFIFNNLVESSYLQPKNFLNSIFILIVVYILNSRNLIRFRQDNRKQNLNFLNIKTQYDK